MISPVEVGFTHLSISVFDRSHRNLKMVIATLSKQKLADLSISETARESVAVDLTLPILLVLAHKEQLHSKGTPSENSISHAHTLEKLAFTTNNGLSSGR